MATSRDFHDYVLDRLCRVGEVSARRMMGEYCLYYQGKLVGGIYDNQLLLKITPAMRRLLPDAPEVLPYPQAKQRMLAVADIEDVERMRDLLDALYLEL